MNKLVFGLLLVVSVGCGSTLKANKFDVDRLANDARYVAIVRHRGAEDKYGRPQVHACLEPTGAAVTLNKLNVALAGEGGNAAGQGKGSITLDNAQSVGQLYMVSEIMQLAHASLYRLCEARSNFDITPEQYAPLYQDTMRTTAVLMCVQARLSKDARLAQKEAQVALLETRIQALEGKMEAERKKASEAEVKALAKVKGNKAASAAAARLFANPPQSQDANSISNDLTDLLAAEPAAVPLASEFVRASSEKADLSKDLDDAKRVRDEAKAELEGTKAQKDTCDEMLKNLPSLAVVPNYDPKLYPIPGESPEKFSEQKH